MYNRTWQFWGYCNETDPENYNSEFIVFCSSFNVIEINFESVIDPEKFLATLCEIPGIGPWTAQYIAMRALGEPDAFPASDLGLLRAMNLTSPRELEKHAGAWRPWRAYAAIHLWSMPQGQKNPNTQTDFSQPVRDLAISAIN